MNEVMTLKILLPYGVFDKITDVKRVVIDTYQGWFGFWPNRLDCTAALTPGILTYQTVNGEEKYVAVDEGVVTKAGPLVCVSVHNAIEGKGLGKLQKAVDRDRASLTEQEVNVREVLAKLETGFIRQFRMLKE